MQRSESGNLILHTNGKRLKKHLDKLHAFHSSLSKTKTKSMREKPKYSKRLLLFFVPFAEKNEIIFFYLNKIYILLLIIFFCNI